jgi:creatinine amidohydrolase
MGMRISDMDWRMVEDWVRHDDRCALPLGSTEQHAGLSLATDAILAERVAAEAAEPLGVPVFPVLPYGLTPYFTAFPGTVTLRVATYAAVLRDVLDSLKSAGFRRVLIVNGHGGNISALAAFLPDFARETSLALRVTTPYEPAQQAMAPILEDQDRVHHACEVETSMMMVLAPDTVRREKLPEAHGPQHWTPQPAGVARYVSFRDATVSGVIGDARRANAQKGEKLVAAVRDAIVAILRDARTWS